MLNVLEAGQIVKNHLPESVFVSYIEYDGKYIFKVYHISPGETGFAPFFSVDRKTGKLMDFRPFGESDSSKVQALFLEADRMGQWKG